WATSDAPTPAAAWLGAAAAAGSGHARPRRLLLSPGATARLGAAGVDAGRPVEVLVGPESGLSPAEEERAIQAGYEPVRLGARILRTETAGLAALAALQAIAGDF